MSDERGRRIGLNEALFRRVNEEIEALNESFGSSGPISVICECGDGQCMEQIEIPLAAYESVRTNSLLYIVVSGHEIPDVETVVQRADGWVVVRKHDGEPAKVSERTDPRS